MFNQGDRFWARPVTRSPKLARRGFLMGACLVSFLGAIPASDAAGSDAFRFLTQASFGPTAGELDRVQTLGIPAYLEDQFNQPQSGYPDAQYTYLSLKTSADCNNKDPSGANYPASAPQAV